MSPKERFSGFFSGLSSLPHRVARAAFSGIVSLPFRGIKPESIDPSSESMSDKYAAWIRENLSGITGHQPITLGELKRETKAQLGDMADQLKAKFRTQLWGLLNMSGMNIDLQPHPQHVYEAMGAYGLAQLISESKDSNVIREALILGGAKIGENVKFNGPLTLHEYGRRGDFSNLTIGDDAEIGAHVFLDMTESITIGAGAVLEDGVIVLTHLQLSDEKSEVSKDKLASYLFPTRHEPVVLEEKVDVVAGCIIECGTHVGENTRIVESMNVSGKVEANRDIGLSAEGKQVANTRTKIDWPLHEMKGGGLNISKEAHPLKEQQASYLRILLESLPAAIRTKIWRLAQFPDLEMVNEKYGIAGLAKFAARSINSGLVYEALCKGGAQIDDSIKTLGPNIHLKGFGEDFSNLAIGDGVHVGNGVEIDLSNPVTLEKGASLGMRSRVTGSVTLRQQSSVGAGCTLESKTGELLEIGEQSVVNAGMEVTQNVPAEAMLKLDKKGEPKIVDMSRFMAKLRSLPLEQRSSAAASWGIKS